MTREPDLFSSPAADAERLQRQASSPDLNVFVSANAGSGKTRVLVDRVVRLLLRGTAPERILCLTYTKAAANEMQRRLFARLGGWTVAKNEDLAADLAAIEPGSPKPSPAQLKTARALFARALESPGGLKVQTIHAFCERLLKRFPLEAGVAPGFEVLDDVEAEAAADRARRQIAARAALSDAVLAAAFATLAARVDDRSASEFLDWIVQRRSILAECLHRHGGAEAATEALAAQLKIDADATGDGERARAWAAAPLDDLRAAAASLAAGTGKSDGDLAAALDCALNGGDPTACYDLYCAFLFTQGSGSRAGAGPMRASFGTKPTVANAPILARLFGDKNAYGPEAKRMEAARDSVRAAEILELTRAGLAVAEAYLVAYEAEKRRRHALDFADLVEAARRLLTSSESAPWVLYKLDGGVDHVLVDEAQDTAPDQWDLVEALTAEFYAGAGASHAARTTFIVGDEKQSIYSFQGADPARFIEAAQNLDARVVAGGAKFESIPFKTSFRCAPQVLEAVDAVFQLPEVELALFTGGPPRGDKVSHAAARRDAPGVVEWWPLEPRPDTPEQDDAWAPVDAPPRGDPRAALAARIARTVRDWIKTGEGVADRDAEKAGERRLRPMRPGDVMILVRRRDTVFQTVIKELKACGVPVAGADRMTLKMQLAVEDLLGAARAALLPEDDLAVAELLKSPLVHPIALETPPITEEALFELAHGRQTSLFRRLTETKDPRFAEAAALVKDLVLRAEREGPFAFLAGLLDRKSPSGESYARRLYKRLGPEAEDPIEELLARALAHERRRAPSLERFVHETLVDSVEVKREGGEHADVVRVMTVHGAKGLEAPVVIIPDLGAPRAGRPETSPFLSEEGFIWGPYKSEDVPVVRALRTAREEAADAESLRLLYVAMTRAEDRLIVCAPEPGNAVNPMCWHSLVERGMRTAQATTFDAPTGDKGLRLGTPERASEAGAEKPAKKKTAVGGRKAPGAHPIAPPAWATRSAAEDGRKRRIVSPARGLSPDAPAPAALSPIAEGAPMRFRRGRLVHRLLEFLPDVDRARRRAAAERFLTSEGELDPQSVDALLAETFAVLDHPELSALFGPDSRGEAPLLGRSPHLPEGVVVNGRVDRLVVGESEVMIVDFKTDRPPPKAPEKVDSVYLEQMAAYRALLRVLYPKKRVRAALLWTDGPRLMELPEALLDGALRSA